VPLRHFMGTHRNGGHDPLRDQGGWNDRGHCGNHGGRGLEETVAYILTYFQGEVTQFGGSHGAFFAGAVTIEPWIAYFLMGKVMADVSLDLRRFHKDV
jgi:hypothetical protein